MTPRTSDRGHCPAHETLKPLVSLHVQKKSGNEPKSQPEPLVVGGQTQAQVGCAAHAAEIPRQLYMVCDPAVPPMKL